MLDMPSVPGVSRLTPAGSVTCAPTWGAKAQPVLVTANATIPVAPWGSKPTGLILALSWPPTPGAGADAVAGDPVDDPTDGWLAGVENSPGAG
jgi:hypothetical protein